MKILAWSYERKLMIIIGFLFLLRLFHITYPPIETAHNWRQTTSLMVARNFYQLDNNILYPTIDECGNKRGVIGMEFPILPYSAYLISIPFGYDHWYGRLVGLFIVSFGIWFFYRLLRMYFDEQPAFYAAIAFAFSSLFHLARKVMPDPISLSLVVMGVYYGTLFLKTNNLWHGLFYLLFAGLGTLVKIPFGLFLVLLAFPFFDKNNKLTTKIIFALLSVVIISAVYWWYFVWNFHLMETFGQWYNSGRSISEGWHELQDHWTEVLEKFYFSGFHSYLFSALALAGLVYAIYRKNKTALLSLMVISPFIAIYMLKSGFLFAHHGYYALVVMPILAMLVGVLLSSIDKRWAIFLLLAAVVESVANQQHDFFIRKESFVKVQLEAIADQVSDRSDLVALVSNENPNEFYFLNRKGWLVPSDHLNPLEMAKLKSMGCKLLFIRRGVYQEPSELERVFETQDYVVFKL